MTVTTFVKKQYSEKKNIDPTVPVIKHMIKHLQREDAF